jgi:hypothetical protein
MREAFGSVALASIVNDARVALNDLGEFTGTVACSTEGTLDWFSMTSFQTPPRAVAAATGLHSKAKGGFICDSFTWLMGAGTLTTFTQADSLTATSDAADTAHTAALNTTTFAGMHTPSASHTGWGFRFIVPSNPQVLRTLRLYLLSFSCIVTVSAKLLDGSYAEQTKAIDSGSGANAHRKIECTYKGSGDLLVTALATTVHTGTANIKLGAITLAS